MFSVDKLYIICLRHMKENNKSKASKNIFYQVRRWSAIIARLLWYFTDEGWWKICC